jgi:hypothetical protein
MSACGAVVIVAWGYDSSGANAHGHATTHIGSAVNAAAINGAHVNAPAIDASRVNTASPLDGPICQCISGETCDAEDGSRGD